ncbi:hypothetical protein MKY98_22190 [Paenibacillus sp. FSL M8-0228]|jgi:hypothetical protein|nr:hypothetical protein [Paenibacillus polymyxa]
MEKLETLVAKEFDMEVQKACTGQCDADCIEGTNNCTSNTTTWY